MSYPLTAILSDVHGNVPALGVALADARERGVRRYVCLGDVVGYGACPRECLDVIMRLCVQEPRPSKSEEPVGAESMAPGVCLQGNHEYALLGSAEDFNPKARAAIEWTKSAINGEEDPDRRFAYWDFIASLEPQADDGTAMFAHGSPRDPVREYMLPRDVHDEMKMKAVFASMNGSGVCFVGHSHVPAVYYEDLRLYRPTKTEGPYDLGDFSKTRAIVNVGSVGQPRDGDPRLSYVIFDGRNLTFVRLKYDVETAMYSIREVPQLPDYLAARLAVGR